jgi:cytochrome c oxidase assembly protein subunit 11
MIRGASDLATRNRRVGLLAAGVVAGMVGLSYAAVPLYEMFCRVTGFGGTTTRASVAPGRVAARVMTVRFNASMHGQLPWKFVPLQTEATVQLGEERVIWYRATNLSKRPIVGTATYNVTPEIAGPFFNKLQCFCFTEQLLQPGESIDMPVSFFIDPEMANERRYDGVRTVTLSYTFFESTTDRARKMLEELPPAGGAAGTPAAPARKGGS